MSSTTTTDRAGPPQPLTIHVGLDVAARAARGISDSRHRTTVRVSDEEVASLTPAQLAVLLRAVAHAYHSSHPPSLVVEGVVVVDWPSIVAGIDSVIASEAKAKATAAAERADADAKDAAHLAVLRQVAVDGVLREVPAASYRRRSDEIPQEERVLEAIEQVLRQGHGWLYSRTLRADGVLAEHADLLGVGGLDAMRGRAADEQRAADEAKAAEAAKAKAKATASEADEAALLALLATAGAVMAACGAPAPMLADRYRAGVLPEAELDAVLEAAVLATLGLTAYPRYERMPCDDDERVSVVDPDGVSATTWAAYVAIRALDETAEVHEHRRTRHGGEVVERRWSALVDGIVCGRKVAVRLALPG